MNREIAELLEKVYPLENPENCRKKFAKRRRKNTLLAAVAVLFFIAVFLVRAAGNGGDIPERKVERPEFGSRSISLFAEYGKYKRAVELKVSARERSPQEAQELLGRAGELLGERILGKNLSLDSVTQNLVLLEELPEYDIEIVWKTSDRELVSVDGSVHNKELSAAQPVVLRARLCYGEFVQECEYEVLLQPYPYTQEELLERRLYEELEACEEETAGEDYLLLPETLEGNEVIWRGGHQDVTGIVLLLGGVLVFAVYGREASLLRKKKKEREEELLMDYPEFLSRFTLLIGAGMTVRNAWERMLADYKKSGRKRFVYEEMQHTMAQLEVGMPELRAYEQFGRRCALLSYLRFTTILTQNLKKGSSGIALLLRMEAQEAFSERKNQARRKGEEAGTKLLLPMGGMLVLVFVLILVPAFASFPV